MTSALRATHTAECRGGGDFIELFVLFLRMYMILLLINIKWEEDDDDIKNLSLCFFFPLIYVYV